MMRDDYNYRFKLTDYTQLDRNRKRKVAVYGRVSTEHEAQIAALENQMQWYDDQARYHPNWEIQDRYIDEGITGTQAKKRPSFLRMIDDARQGKFDLIVTREVCRFARNVVDTLVITRELKGIGVEVYFIEDNIWTMDGDGELRLSLMATLAQEESRKTSERVRAGQKVSREKGVLYGNGNILGYDRVGDTYQINEEQAETVRMIFDLYLQGKGSLQIANELNARHRKSAMGMVKWCASSVVRVLKNATYTGTKCYNKSRNNNYLDQHRVLNLDASTYLYQEGDFPAIVSKEIWNKAQSIRINRRKAVALRDGKVTISNRTSEDIWVNKLRCSCGYACRRDKWHVRKDGSVSYGYQCYNRINNGSKQKREEMGLDSEGYCGIRMYGDWKLEMMADTLFEQLLGDKHQIIQTALELLKKYYRESSRKDQQGNSERKIQLERIDTRLRNLTVMRADGEIGKEEYQQLRDQLEAERSRLEEEQKKAESVECREAMDLDRIQQALEELVHLKGKGVSRELIDQIVYRVTPVSETHFEWYLHLGPGTDAQASLLVEGKKGNCVPSVNGIREFLNPGEVKTDVGASQILGSLPTEQLHRLPSRTPASKLRFPRALA